jgi:MFS superfamily sulfate permease-like transporter
MEAQHKQELHWGWLVAFALLLIVLLFAFGDILTGIVGTLVLSIVFAGYHNAQQHDHH